MQVELFLLLLVEEQVRAGELHLLFLPQLHRPVRSCAAHRTLRRPLKSVPLLRLLQHLQRQSRHLLVLHRPLLGRRLQLVLLLRRSRWWI
jgi:hypothetical protein